MKRQYSPFKAPRLQSLVFALSLGLFCLFSGQTQNVYAQSYPGAGGSQSGGGGGMIYLPNGMPFQIGSNYPGGLHFPNNPNFYTPPSSSRYPSYYSNSYRNRGRGNSSLLNSQNAQQTKKTTTWEAPTKIDDKIDTEIESTQVDYGIDSPEAMNLIWSRAKQYYEGHHYEKALKMLDQLEPLRKKKDNLSLISDASIDKMRRDIDLKLGKNSYRARRRSQYFSGGSSSSSSSPIPLDSFLDPSRNSQNNFTPQRGRSFYP